MIIRMQVAAAAIAGVMIVASGTAALAGVAAPGKAPPVKRLTSKTFAVTVSVPASWTRTPYSGTFAYSGTSGWMSLNAATEPGGMKATCRVVAADGALHIFGKHPRIIFRAIDDRPGCVILPSKDAPRVPVRRGGPAFQTAEALVAYRHPLTIDGTAYPLLVIFADPAHVTPLVNSAQLRH